MKVDMLVNVIEVSDYKNYYEACINRFNTRAARDLKTKLNIVLAVYFKEEDIDYILEKETMNVMMQKKFSFLGRVA